MDPTARLDDFKYDFHDCNHKLQHTNLSCSCLSVNGTLLYYPGEFITLSTSYMVYFCLCSHEKFEDRCRKFT